MNLSDELGKTDSLVESIVRKIEKTASELALTSSGTNSSTTGRTGQGRTIELSVGGVPPQRYVQQFAWDSAKYPNRRPLKELVQLIAGGASSIEEELKQLQQSFSDKLVALQDVKRRKDGNLLSADLNDVLNDTIMQHIKVVNTEYLKTLFIAIPNNLQELFLRTIPTLGNDLVGYGGPDWTRDGTKLGEPVFYGPNVDRHKVRGSPVVPDSIQLVHKDHDSMLYAVTILRGQYEAGYYENDEFQQGTKVDFESEFIKACREKRFVVRADFEYDPTQSSKSSMALEQLQVEVDGMQSALTRWCKNHYGDVFVAWMHIKVIRIFVESVLRYGLPVDFTAVLYKIHRNREHDLIKALDQNLGSTQHAHLKDDDNQDDEEEYHDFVMLKFEP